MLINNLTGLRFDVNCIRQHKRTGRVVQYKLSLQAVTPRVTVCFMIYIKECGSTKKREKVMLILQFVHQFSLLSLQLYNYVDLSQECNMWVTELANQSQQAKRRHALDSNPAKRNHNKS